jgi:hypothetical protein
MSEAEPTALAVRGVYSAYYSEMGGAGAAPEFQRRPKRLNLSPDHRLRASQGGQ